MTSSRPRPPVAVVFGGPSAEHDVSIVSGSAIAEALRVTGEAVSEIVIDLAAEWWWLPPEHRRGDRAAAAYDEPAALGGDGPVNVGAAIERLTRATPQPLVFIALHGPFGEDGTIQGLLGAAGLAYTGAGVAASAIGMDKGLQKRLWRGLGLPVPDWREVTIARWAREREGVLLELEAFAAANRDPRLMVKPARLGSSVGMTLAHAAEQRAAALELAFRYDSRAVVERYLAGARDLEVSVIGNEPPLGIYGPGEVIAGHEFYDYAAKYTPGLSETMVRAELPTPQRELIRKLARDAYRAIGTEGFARVDFLVVGADVYLSEINTIPGFTPISLFPTLPAEGGLDFSAVCLRVIDLALERHNARSIARLQPADLPR